MTHFEELGEFLLKQHAMRLKDTLVKKDDSFWFKKKQMAGIIQKELPADFSGVCICENILQNVKILKEHWATYNKNQVTIIFLITKTGNKWSIKPHLHSQVCPADQINKSVDSLFKQSQQ